MKSVSDCYTLTNGVQIPCIGLGTWQALDGAAVQNAVKAAISSGYRHIDTAAAYKNETGVGKGIRDSRVPREEIFITSKLQNADHGYQKTVEAFEKTLRHLRVSYLDLYLIHWPNPLPYRDCWEKVNAETWRAFEEFYKDGRIRAIGVSNFHPHHLDAIMQTATIAPMVNQIRLCPGDYKTEIIEYCRKNNILAEAYSPLGGSGSANLLHAPPLLELAKKYKKKPAQICIKWCLQNGFLPLPKSVTSQRIEENMDVFDFTLEESDIALLSELTGYPDPFPHPDQAHF